MAFPSKRTWRGASPRFRRDIQEIKDASGQLPGEVIQGGLIFTPIRDDTIVIPPANTLLT